MSNKSVSLAQGYAPLYNPFEQFFSRYVYRRVRHIFNRPICSAPGAEVTLKERCTDDYNWSFRYTHTHTQYITITKYVTGASTNYRRVFTAFITRFRYFINKITISKVKKIIIKLMISTIYITLMPYPHTQFTRGNKRVK